MALTRDIIAAYLPHGVMTTCVTDSKPRMLICAYHDSSLIKVSGDHWAHPICKSATQINLLLRPMSGLDMEITHRGKTFNPIDKLRRTLVSDSYEHDDFDHDIHFLMRGDAYIGQFRNDLVTLLRSLHFDTDGLIKAGLAIDINTFKS